MTTAAIKIPFQINLQSGEAGTWSFPSWDNDTYTPAGWLLTGSGTTIYTYSMVLPVPIPLDINTVEPNAKVIVYWTTNSTQTETARVATMKVTLSKAADQGNLNPELPGETLPLFIHANDDTGHNFEVTQPISVITLTPGDTVFGKILRNPAEDDDTLVDSVILRQVLFVADDSA